MKIKSFLIGMTFIAVLSDYMLHPFYPQFFQLRFGISAPDQVGYYFAALCLMVMISFPFWAQVSKKTAELNILICTQLIAGILALYCYSVSSYAVFWVVSMTMVFFKGSYLMVYPYLLKTVSAKEHGHTIGLLSVIVHLGGILGAMAGGTIVDLVNAESIFLIMAGSDFLLMGTSIYLLTSKRHETGKAEAPPVPSMTGTKNYLVKIGVITLILYYSDFLVRPFFVLFWEGISTYSSGMLSGTLYAIPGLVALFALWYNKKYQKTMGAQGIPIALALGIVGLLLQGTGLPLLVVAGRVIYGWAIFQGDVRFDLLLFRHSTPGQYSVDYSKVHFFQNLGVLLASLSTGVLVDRYGLGMPFHLAAMGVLATLAAYFLLFKGKYRMDIKPSQA